MRHNTHGKSILSILLIITLLGSALIWVSATGNGTPATHTGWEPLYAYDFEGGSFPMEIFTPFDVYAFNADKNYKTENGNSYFSGGFAEGASLFTRQTIENYAMECLLQTNGGGSNFNQNCYKSAFAVKLNPDRPGSDLFEPDNTDNEGDSYLGYCGIYFYAYDDILEVAIARNIDGGQSGPVNAADFGGRGSSVIVADASARAMGAYSTGYLFRMADGVSFNQFTKLRVECTEDTVQVYVADTLICRIELSGAERTTVGSRFDNEAYRHATLYGADGSQLLALDGCVVAKSGGMAFVNRANTCNVDDLTVYTRVEAPTEPETEAPTEPETEAPTEPETEAPTEPETETTAESETESGNGDLVDDETDSDGGCFAGLGIGGLTVILAITGGAALLGRKKEQ